MSLFFFQVLSSLLIYRYLALFAITFLGSFGLPVFAGPSVIAASAFASQGYFNFLWVVIFGSAGNIIGDITFFWLVRRYGQKILARLHLRKLADSPVLRSAAEIAETYKAPVILISRFQTQATAIVNVLAGLGKINFKRFALLVFGGEILQIVFYAAIGYLFSDTWEAIYTIAGEFSWVIVLFLIIIFAITSTKITRRRLK